MSAEIETLHVPFRDWLETQKGRIAYTYHRPDCPTGATKGDADFVCYAGNSVLMLEMKDKDTKVSKDQVARHAELLAVGITVHIVRDINTAIELATAWRSMVGVVSAKTKPPVETLNVGGVEWISDGKGGFSPPPKKALTAEEIA